MMKRFLIGVCLILPVFGFSQKVISSGVYSWPKENKGSLVNGVGHDMKYLKVSANAVPSDKGKAKIKAQENEQLLIVRSGMLTVYLQDSIYTVGTGSVALIIPGDSYSLGNTGNAPATYYLMEYAAKVPDTNRSKTSGGSFVKDWTKIEFKEHERGGRRDFFEQPTPMSKRFEMHVTTLNAGLKSHDPHTHRAEEIVLILEGKTEMQIEDKFYKAAAGDLIFLASNSLHAIRNEGATTCTYFAFQWE